MKYELIYLLIFSIFTNFLVSQKIRNRIKSPHLGIMINENNYPKFTGEAESCLKNINKNKIKIKFPSKIENFYQNLLIRTDIPDYLSGEFSLEKDKIVWTGDMNPSSLIVNIPNVNAPHSFTIKKAFLLFEPLHLNVDSDFELIVLTNVFGSDDSNDKQLNLFLSIKIKINEEINPITMRKLIQIERDNIINSREASDEIKRIEDINTYFNKFINQNNQTTFDNILINFTNFRERIVPEGKLDSNDISFDYSNYNLNLKSILDYVGKDIIAYEFSKFKHSICGKSLEYSFVYQFEKPIEISKEFSVKLKSINYDMNLRRKNLLTSSDKINELASDVKVLEVIKSNIFKSFNKKSSSFKKPNPTCINRTPTESVTQLDSFSSWRNSKLSFVKNNNHHHKKKVLNIKIDSVKENPMIKKQMDMLGNMLKLMDDKYKKLEMKYTDLKVFNDTFNIKKPCISQESNNTKTNITNNSIDFNNFNYPEEFTIRDIKNNFTRLKLPTIMKRENIAFDNGTVIIFQTIMIDTKNKTLENLNKQYEKFHRNNFQLMKKSHNLKVC